MHQIALRIGWQRGDDGRAAPAHSLELLRPNLGGGGARTSLLFNSLLGHRQRRTQQPMATLRAELLAITRMSHHRTPHRSRLRAVHLSTGWEGSYAPLLLTSPVNSSARAGRLPRVL